MKFQTRAFCLAATAAFSFALMPAISSFAQSSQVAPSFEAQLTSKANSKDAKVGEAVAAKTLVENKLADGTVIPKGTKLLGKVTSVQSMAEGHGVAMLALTFDQIEKKGGSTTPIHGVLIAIAPRPSMADSGASGALPAASTRGAGEMSAMTGGTLEGNAGPQTLQPGSSVKGLALSPNLDKDGSAVLTSTNKDIKLESGMRVEIGVQ